MKLHARLALGIAFLVMAIAPLTFAGDAKEEAIKKDRKQYEGTWQVVSLEINGNKAAEEDARKITVINEADGKWTIEVEGKVVARGTSQIDPTKKPKAIDLTVTEGDNKGKTFPAIYELGGNTWKVCFGQPDRERPAEFSAPPGSEQVFVVLKRVKK